MSRVCWIGGMSVVLVGLSSTGAEAATCAARATGVIFDAYDPLNGHSNDTGVGSVEVECDSAANYTIALDRGINPGPAGERRMTGPGGKPLSYNLYTDVGFYLVWGDGSSGASNTVAGSAARSSFPVYGRIPADQQVSPGNYSDRVVVTISFD